MQRRYLSIYFQRINSLKLATPDFASLISLCRHYTPLVSQDPFGLLLDTTGCEDLFGGERSLLFALHKDLRQNGFHAQLAIAPTALCARAMAKYKPLTILQVSDLPKALYSLPIESLELEERAAHTFHELGIRKLVELFRLPRAQILTRFGLDVINRIEAIRGERQEAHIFIDEKPSFFIKEDLMETIYDSSYLLDAIFDILRRLCTTLSKSGLGLQRLEIILTHTNRKQTHLKIGLVSATSNVTQIFRLLCLKLEQLQLDLGVESVEIKALEVKDVLPKEVTLSGQCEGDKTNISALFDTLLCRLEQKNIFQYIHHESHIPEYSYKMIDPATIMRNLPLKNTAKPDNAQKKRPTHLFDPPEAIRVVAMLPDSPPRKIVWRNKFVFQIKKADGPERIELPWWCASKGETRDYYHIEDERGVRLWVFKQIQTDKSDNIWFIHGLLA